MFFILMCFHAMSLFSWNIQDIFHVKSDFFQQKFVATFYVWGTAPPGPSVPLAVAVSPSRFVPDRRISSFASSSSSSTSASGSGLDAAAMFAERSIDAPANISDLSSITAVPASRSTTGLAPATATRTSAVMVSAGFRNVQHTETSSMKDEDEGSTSNLQVLSLWHF